MFLIMKDSKQLRSSSRTVESNPKASNQASARETLQMYRGNTIIQLKKFIGKSSAVHIHLEGRFYHVKFGSDQSSRLNFDPQKRQQIQTAYEYTRDNLEGEGKQACLTWFLEHGAVEE